MSAFSFDSAVVPSSAQASDVTTVGTAGAPAFDSAWVDSGDAANDPVGFLRINNVVHMVGVTTGGVAGTNIFTLPVGFRPSKKRVIPVVSNGALGVITILATGAVEVTVGSILGVNLSGVSFVSV
jgi:hypothetical protein